MFPQTNVYGRKQMKKSFISGLVSTRFQPESMIACTALLFIFLALPSSWTDTILTEKAAQPIIISSQKYSKIQLSFSNNQQHPDFTVSNFPQIGLLTFSLGFRIGYDIPMFCGFIIMFFSTLSKSIS